MFILLLFWGQSLRSQYVYTIKADSVKITNNCDTAELILENRTRDVRGFLYNKWNGRTEFRKGFIRINDSLFLVGDDTINLNSTLKSITANNGLQKIGNNIQFGNDTVNVYSPAQQIRPATYYQNGQFFNWMTGSNGIFTVSKFKYGTTSIENNVLKSFYVARFANHAQGGILIEGTHKAQFHAPITWINFKNNHPDASTFGFYNDPITAQIMVAQRQGTDNKSYPIFYFTLASNTTSPHTNGVPLRLYPAFTSSSGGPILVPTAVAARIDISEAVPGAADNFFPLSYNNPYSRLVINAQNYPLVVGNLPRNSTNGRFLIIDSAGKIWRGDTTASLPPAPVIAKLTADQSTTATSAGNAAGLSVNVTAGQYYKIKAIVVFRSSDLSTGIKLGLTAPAATVFSASAAIPSATDGVTNTFKGWITSSGDIVSASSVENANTDYIAIIEGIITPSVTGALQLTFASSSGSQVTIRPGSLITVESY